MTYQTSNLHPLDEELKAASAELDARRMALLKNGVQMVLDEIIAGIKPLAPELKTMKIKNDDLINLTAKTIAEACNGRLLVPHLSLPTDKTSPIWVWNGMYWDDIGDKQIYYDFIKDACLKMGLSEDLADSPNFSKKLNKVVEKKISRNPRKNDTEGLVLVPLLNGVLEINREGERTLRQHRRDDYFRYVIPFKYDEQAQCPRFCQFLDEVLPDKGIQLVVLEYFAKCFVPWLRIEKLMALLGSGSNGKSVLLGVLQGLFGEKNVSHENLHDLTYDEVHRANIEGKPLNICTENEGRIKESILRTMVSGEPITCKKLYSQPFETSNYARLLFAFNEMPMVKNTVANMRRWILVKFDVHITEEQADMELGETLAAELPGILNLVLSVLPELIKRKKFSKSEGIDNALREMEFDNDPVLQFLTQRCECHPSFCTKASDLFKAFCEFCQQNNIPNELRNQGFYRRLEELHHKPFMDNTKQKSFHIKIARYED